MDIVRTSVININETVLIKFLILLWIFVLSLKINFFNV